ncbi:hypothetical protein [uncultured Chryseobacterium sp.]|uniref:hypothetical protein n=1 Tax=uncultured Chryseobacterium sp. TaxID=259322 RepID=UPI0025905B7A|nr:hypothetical protein [uncultured Chryseobacterium sp.]
MKKLNFLFFFSVFIFMLECKKDNHTINNHKMKIMSDTIKYSADAKGNRLSGIITVQKKGGPKIFTADQLDSYLAGEFLFHAEKGVLTKLKKNSGEKKYFDTYDVAVSTFKTLYENKHDESVGLKLCFFELDKDYGLINVPSSYKNFLYMIAVPVDTDGLPVGSDNKYVIFNLLEDFDINKSKIQDEEYDRLASSFNDKGSEIYVALKDYYSRKGKGNTTSVFYSWGDIRDNINKFCDTNKYDNIKFRLAEVIGINSIRYYIDRNPQLKLDEDKYEFAYTGREKQLTIIGEFYLMKSSNGVKQSVSSNTYFDMGSLYP